PGGGVRGRAGFSFARVAPLQPGDGGARHQADGATREDKQEFVHDYAPWRGGNRCLVSIRYWMVTCQESCIAALRGKGHCPARSASSARWDTPGEPLTGDTDRA